MTQSSAVRPKLSVTSENPLSGQLFFVFSDLFVVSYFLVIPSFVIRETKVGGRHVFGE